MIFFYSETKKSQMEDTVHVLFMNKQYLLLKVLYSASYRKILSTPINWNAVFPNFVWSSLILFNIPMFKNIFLKNLSKQSDFKNHEQLSLNTKETALSMNKWILVHVNGFCTWIWYLHKSLKFLCNTQYNIFEYCQELPRNELATL